MRVLAEWESLVLWECFPEIGGEFKESKSGRIWMCPPTVDGSEIRLSPVDMVNMPLFSGFRTCQVVQGF